MEYDYLDTNSSEWENIDAFNPYEFEELEYYSSLHLFVQQYVVSLTKLILCVFVVANDSLLIYAIRRFKSLQTKTNYILLNVVVCNLFFTISSTILSLMEALFSPYSYWYAMEYIVSISIGYLSLQIIFLFTLLLAFDWLISANFRNILSQYQKYYKWIIAGIYVLCLMVNGITLICKLNERMWAKNTAIITHITYLLCILTLIVINIIKYRKTYTQESLKTVYSLHVANIFYVLWLPLFVMMVVYLILAANIEHVKFSIIVILAIITYLLEFIAYIAPILTYVMLLKYDKNFKMSFDCIFKRSVRNYVPSDDNDNINDDLIP